MLSQSGASRITEFRLGAERARIVALDIRPSGGRFPLGDGGEGAQIEQTVCTRHRDELRL